MNYKIHDAMRFERDHEGDLIVIDYPERRYNDLTTYERMIADKAFEYGKDITMLIIVGIIILGFALYGFLMV